MHGGDIIIITAMRNGVTPSNIQQHYYSEVKLDYHFW